MLVADLTDFLHKFPAWYDVAALAHNRFHIDTRHMLTLNCGVYGNGMRFATPLNVKKEEIDESLQILEEAICEVEAV